MDHKTRMHLEVPIDFWYDASPVDGIEITRVEIFGTELSEEILDRYHGELLDFAFDALHQIIEDRKIEKGE